MAAETYVIGGLGTLVTVLGGIVISALNQRLGRLERKQETDSATQQTLIVAVAELTVEVKHLNAALAKGISQ